MTRGEGPTPTDGAIVKGPGPPGTPAYRARRDRGLRAGLPRFFPVRIDDSHHTPYEEIR